MALTQNMVPRITISIYLGEFGFKIDSHLHCAYKNPDAKETSSEIGNLFQRSLTSKWMSMFTIEVSIKGSEAKTLRNYSPKPMETFENRETGGLSTKKLIKDFSCC